MDKTNYKYFDELIDDILDEKSDRALIIYSCSIIDDQLYEILKMYLIDSKESKDELLLGDSPLSTLSSRIKIAYRLGIIDVSFVRNLDLIRKIRNKCAHNVRLNIKEPPISDLINNLKNNLNKRETYKLTLKRYFDNDLKKKDEFKALLVTVCVILHAIKCSIGKLTINEKTIEISKK